jgi:hypothetical protein
MCRDYHKNNQDTKPDYYDMPIPREIFEAVEQAKVFQYFASVIGILRAQDKSK